MGNKSLAESPLRGKVIVTATRTYAMNGVRFWPPPYQAVLELKDDFVQFGKDTQPTNIFIFSRNTYLCFYDAVLFGFPRVCNPTVIECKKCKENVILSYEYTKLCMFR